MHKDGDHPLKELAEEYLRLGGQRRAAVDDNQTSTRKWEPEPAAAERFWKERVETLPSDRRRDFETYLPSINGL